jgi:hypothetical protein
MMTRQEWIKNNFSFYHITKTSNLESIFLNGIENRNGLGVCVVRTRNDLIVRYICEMMLNVDDDLNFSIIEIKPTEIQLQAEEILDDNVNEITNCLHNYIQRPSIAVSAENVVGVFQANPLGIPNLTNFENEIRNTITLESLQ